MKKAFQMRWMRSIAGLFVAAALVGMYGVPAQADQNLYSEPHWQPAIDVAQTDPWQWNIEFVNRWGGSYISLTVADAWVGLSVGPEIWMLDISNPVYPQIASRFDLGFEISDMQFSGHYLYVIGKSPGLFVFDMSDPYQPLLLKRIITDEGFRNIRIVGAIAYLTTRSGYFKIFDVSNPINPTELSSIWMGFLYFTVEGSYVYGVAGDEIYIIDATMPTSPVVVGRYKDDVWIYKLMVSGRYMYVSLWGREAWRFIVLDVSDPSHPVKMASVDTAQQVVDFAISGSYLYVVTREQLYIFDNSRVPVLSEVALLNSTDPNLHGIAIAGHYAYVCSFYRGVWIVDVTNPAQPISKGWLENSGGAGWDIAINGDYLYVSGAAAGQLGIVNIAQRMNPWLVGVVGRARFIIDMNFTPPYLFVTPWDGTILVYDVSQPARPVEVGVFDIHDSTRFFTLAYRDSLLFVAESGQNAAPPGRFRILDVSDPANIRQLGMYTFTTPAGESGLEGVVLAGNYAYVGARQQGLLVIDISDPTNPSLAGSIDIFTNQRDVEIAGNFVYVSDAFGEQRGIHILDISDPVNPTPVGFYDTGIGNPHSFAIINHYLYVPSGDALRVVDVSNPARPVEVARYSGMCGYLNSVAVVWPYVYVGAQDCGLYTLWFAPGIRDAVVSSDGATLASESDNVRYTFPTSVFTDTVLVNHIPQFEGRLPSAGHLQGIGHAFEVTATYRESGEEAQPVGQYTMTVHYDDRDVGSVIEESLGLYYWDGQQWVREPTSTVDTATNIVSATPDHFSLWAVLGETRRVYLPIVTKRR